MFSFNLKTYSNVFFFVYYKIAMSVYSPCPYIIFIRKTMSLRKVFVWRGNYKLQVMLWLIFLYPEPYGVKKQLSLRNTFTREVFSKKLYNTNEIIKNPLAGLYLLLINPCKYRKNFFPFNFYFSNRKFRTGAFTI